MQAIYHLSSSQEITFDLLESIRNTFKSKPITIVVDEEIEETAHLISSEIIKKCLKNQCFNLKMAKSLF